MSPKTLVSPAMTIAICTRNRAHFLEKAVRSSLAQLGDKTDILIVDNASTDKTSEAAAKLSAENSQVSWIPQTEIGVSATRNAALLHAKGDYVIFLDDDETARPGWLDAYANFFTHPPSQKIGCVGGPY
ncbi:MAG: glycosyltransferase family 2 protein, partial [Limisphaerales bacterium]